jgi:hypothetical protein
MTERQPDIESFLKSDLKSEKMTLRRPTLYRFKNRHKVRKKTKRRLIFQTDINSEKKKQCRADTKSFLKDRCKVRTQMTQRRAAQVFFVDY